MISFCSILFRSLVIVSSSVPIPFIADKLETFKDLTVTRLAQGIPIGGEVHYLDENTLNTAFQSRKKIV